jgi:hypothetical protein
MNGTEEMKIIATTVASVTSLFGVYKIIDFIGGKIVKIIVEAIVKSEMKTELAILKMVNQLSAKIENTDKRVDIIDQRVCILEEKSKDTEIDIKEVKRIQNSNLIVAAEFKASKK